MWIDPWLIPCNVPTYTTTPPTIFEIMNSMVNYGKPEEQKVKPRQLAGATRTMIFDFDYPLSSSISKEDFEKQILNHYIMRSIGFETFLAFQIQLENRLNEIMPTYNKLFDALSTWSIFNDGEKMTRNVNTSGTSDTTTSVSTTSNSTTSADSRQSELPQNEISNVSAGTYLTNYELNQGTDSSTGTSSGTSASNDSGTTFESINRTPSDKMVLYTEYIEKKKNIMSMIYKDLDLLFYSII